ncbi:hypothetical protein BP6252_13653 [Coleophoma cylindrospora]|uniref:Xylanolytic transcriptional activator regulatory domain-containing protein n=1 Tax=Coleophoma cylindrospora TaxID=1849047 RepID=A0A3D8Q8S5_9HELO|nr:hypothetical protein BP6252_13653 [Coleophoma cylindrospora]
MLDSRLVRLEELVNQLEAKVPDGSDSSDAVYTKDVVFSNQAIRPTDNIKGLIARDFWQAISQEVSGLRDILEGSDGEEYDQEPEPVVRSIPYNYGSVATLFDQGMRPIDIPELELPTEGIRTMLLRIYQDRVDKVVKVLHLDTTLDAIKRNHADGKNGVQFPAIQALEFAIYFMAICSITDSEANTMMLGDRRSLIQQYRYATETLISIADLFRNPDLAVLQAFVIYLTGLRACRNIEAMWVLTAVAARVAIARGLGPSDSNNWQPHNLEIRRRLWFGIGILDTNAALERGSIPMLHWEEFQRPPLNINDSDLTSTPIIKIPSCEVTDMSFSCMAYEAMVCHKKICSPPVGPGGPFSEWNKKLRIIADFEDSMRQYSWIDESAKPFERFIRFMAEAIALHMQLLLRRPPYKNKNNPVPPWDDFDLMEVITSLLQKSLQQQAEDVYANWTWLEYPKWYILAILLVELCSCKAVDFSDRAYSVAQAAFDQYAPLMSEIDSGMFWRPIAKLMQRVQILRGVAVPAGFHHQSMGGIEEVEFFNTSKAKNILDSSSFSNQAPVANNQMPPAITIDTGSVSINEFARGSENDPVTDDGMAWINWDLFLTDLGGSAYIL